jgi:hypothetical protein
MTLITKRLIGSDLLQEDLENINFIRDGEGVLFDPPVLDGETLNYACFSNTVHPSESENVSWVSTRLNWERLASQEVTDFLAVITLLGLQLNGNEELIGEKIITTCPTIETVDEVVFNLQGSRGEPPVKNLTGEAAVDKIKVNLPFRYQNLESIALYRNWLTGYPRRRRLPLTGADIGRGYSPVKITIAYDSDMNSDFSDIRFLDSDGATQLCYFCESYTAGVTATFWVYIPNTPSTGAVKSIYYLYDNDTATTLSNGFRTFPILFDDWEDGKYTGRTSPYKNWLLAAGTVTFDTTTPIMGTTTLKHTGNGSNVISNRLQCENSSFGKTSTVYFKFKLTAQGAVAGAPGIYLWIPRFVDTNNYLVLSTSYNSSTDKQNLFLTKVEGGVSTSITSAEWLTGKIPVNTVYDFRIKDSGTSFSVYVDGVAKLSTAYSSTVPGGKVAFGANRDSAAEWDYIRVAPYIYSQPTVGSVGGEETTTMISPDSGLDDDMSVLFSVPADWSPASSCYLRVKEYFSTAYDTDDVKLSNRSIAELGYDNVDRYIALRQRIELWATNLCNVRFNSAEYTYEV